MRLLAQAVVELNNIATLLNQPGEYCCCGFVPALLRFLPLTMPSLFACICMLIDVLRVRTGPTNNPALAQRASALASKIQSVRPYSLPAMLPTLSACRCFTPRVAFRACMRVP
jgi:hypothetical protein